MFEKIFIIFILFAILASLGSGLLFLVRDKGDSKRVLKALTIRICLSIALFALLIISAHLGWIHPHALH